MKKPVVLRIYKGDQLLGVKQFLEPQILIGRDGGSVQVALDGEAVAVLHASIDERDGKYYLADLGSETGTRRNGASVLEAEVESGDELQIGEYKIEFFIGAPKPKAQAAVTSPAPVAPPPQPVAPPPPPVQVLPPPTAVPPPTESQIKQNLNIVPPPIQQATVVEKAPPPVVKVSEPVVPPPVTAPVAAGVGLTAQFVPKAPARPMGKTSVSHKKKSKREKTFAPPSRYSNVREYVKPTKGTVVELLVAWRERVIATYHFSKAATITMGSHPSNDVVLPVFSARDRKIPILKIDRQAVVLVPAEMTGEVIRGQSNSSFMELVRSNRMVRQGTMYQLPLEQGEMAKIDVNDQISILVRYVSDSPKPLAAPLFDLTASELTGIVLSFVMAATLWLYTYLYTPPKLLADDRDDEPLRTAIVLVKPTPPPPLPPPPPQPPEPQPTPPPQVVRATPVPKPQPKPAVAKPAETKPAKPTTQAKASDTGLTSPGAPGKSANLAPTRVKTGPVKSGSVKQGGSIKTSNQANSQMQSKSKDVSKSGVFSVFGTGGAQNELAGSTSGAGELAGLAGAATGRAGMNEDRAGQGLGGLKETGRGGTGKSLEGIAGGIGTQGRGSGNSGYGTGGLGSRQGTKIVTGGEGESIPGSIDKEAIRRVIVANIRYIKNCYEVQLNKNKDLFGKIVITWEIGEQGRVVSGRVKSNELGNREVGECIVRGLRTWRFPDPPANQVVEVDYPFFFSN